MFYIKMTEDGFHLFIYKSDFNEMEWMSVTNSGLIYHFQTLPKINLP